MLPDRVSNPGPLTYESGALPIALRGPATMSSKRTASYQRNRTRQRHHFVLTETKKLHDDSAVTGSRNDLSSNLPRN